MKSLVAVILISASLAGSAWARARGLRPPLIWRYLGADRERLLYEGAKRSQAGMVHVAHALQRDRQELRIPLPGVTWNPIAPLPPTWPREY